MEQLVVVREFSWRFRRDVNKVSKGTVLELNETEGLYMYPGSVLLIAPEALKQLLDEGTVRFQK